MGKAWVAFGVTLALLGSVALLVQDPLAPASTVGTVTTTSPPAAVTPVTIPILVDAGASAVHGSELSRDSFYPHPGNSGYQIEHVDLEIDFRLFPELEGVATFLLEPLEHLASFVLDVGWLEILQVTINGEEASFGHGPELRITPAVTLPADVLSVLVV
jgi:hypothetical protein